MVAIGYGDQLFLRTYGSLASTVVATVSFRAAGQESSLTLPQTPSTDRSLVSSVKDIVVVGELMGLRVDVRSGAVARGQVYATVGLVQHGTYITFASGYVYVGRPVVWTPAYAILEGPTEGPGYIYHFSGTDPAVNVEISQTVPTGARWRPIAIRVELATDATAANRVVHVFLDDPTLGDAIVLIPCARIQTASETVDYNFASGMPKDTALIGASTRLNCPLPSDIILKAGFAIKTLTTARQATDDYGAPKILVEEWIEP